ncbi:hypothetical protein HPB49_009234 [Dermacentor silvarum]|uniref:Uncharacterized protein n=1 Tax=Dermacentor silvarum TaxID=543639 RepID=A0ACB8DXN1_DERSI|nr:hypothetical protein HPB49_009234 [Dermacentor silvarum]
MRLHLRQSRPFSKTCVLSSGAAVVLDEIKLRESVDFNKSTLNFDGFVNCGGHSGEQVAADHALVIMFIPFFHRWVQPVASFATRGAAPGFELAKIVIESVLKLERYGATIIAFVSDGTGNRPTWSHVGILASCHNQSTRFRTRPLKTDVLFTSRATFHILSSV